MTNEELINKADSMLNRHMANDHRLFGDVASALLSETGNVYVGVCADTPTWGICAERSAIAAMITAGEYKIKKVVAVWRDENGENLTVLPPCGVCREFMRQVDYDNMGTEIVLGLDKSETLTELLPAARWPEPLEK